ncbi:MAG TPA: hypothetical protein EYN06_04765 [Myxococcales bacterium]|nr:hypothetical protein [Myxococcales bacterium]
MTSKTPFVAALLSICIPLISCSGDEKPRLPSIELRPIDSFESPLWVGDIPKDDVVVARVEGTPIYLSALQNQVDRAGKDADPTAILDRMIEMELFAREAFKNGKYNFAVVGEAIKKVLTLRWIIRHMEEDISPADVPKKYVDLAYKQYRGVYDHFERFLVVDIQVLCCNDVWAANCFTDLYDDKEKQKQHLKECIDFHELDVQKLHAQLSKAKDLEDFRSIHELASMDLPNSILRSQYQTAATVNEFDFQYDINRSYEKQFEKVRYRMLYKEVMDGVRDAYLKVNKKTPFMVQPIRSPIGWHLIYVYKVIPEKHMKVDHPKVQKEVRKGAFIPWRKIYFLQQMENLCDQLGCEFHHQRMVPLQELDDAVR